MMTDEHNFIMLMETPNAIETEKKILKYWVFLGSTIHDGVKVVKSNGSTGLQAASSEFVFGGRWGEEMRFAKSRVHGGQL